EEKGGRGGEEGGEGGNRGGGGGGGPAGSATLAAIRCAPGKTPDGDPGRQFRFAHRRNGRSHARAAQSDGCHRSARPGPRAATHRRGYDRAHCGIRASLRSRDSLAAIMKIFYKSLVTFDRSPH